jgi:predicted Zn finger-like uncharacterized protein
MRIACPGCAAEYEVPDALLAAGPRMLRCARCGQAFEAGLPQPATAPLPEPEPPPPIEPPAAEPSRPDAVVEEEDRPPPSRGPRVHHPIDPPLPTREEQAAPGRRIALAGWIASILVLGGAAAGMAVFHAEIAAAWPPAARLFQALGLE